MGQLSSWLRCCNDFTDTKQFTGSKDTVFDCFARPLQGVGQRLARLFPSERVCPSLCRAQPPAVGFPCPRGTRATHTGSPRGSAAETQEVSEGRRGRQGCPRAAGDRHGGVKALSLTLLKTRVAWFVRTGCSGPPGVYHTFSSCLQNAVITSCKNQPHPHLIRAKPAQLCTASPARPVC